MKKYFITTLIAGFAALCTNAGAASETIAARNGVFANNTSSTSLTYGDGWIKGDGNAGIIWYMHPQIDSTNATSYSGKFSASCPGTTQSYSRITASLVSYYSNGTFYGRGSSGTCQAAGGDFTMGAVTVPTGGNLQAQLGIYPNAANGWYPRLGSITIVR